MRGTLLAATELDSQPETKVQRVVFHEITKPAIQEAFSHPRDIDMNLVNAQQARRILDRLVGYNVTELLWEKVRNRLSAGRVQSIAVRLIVDREREIEAFVQQEYWTLDAKLRKQQHNGNDTKRSFLARLFKIGDDDVSFAAESDVQPHLDLLKRSSFSVADIKRGERVRRPSAPFTTSTLQQEASRRLGFTAKRTMAVAQQLYEGIDVGTEGSVGLITYMRTDSTAVSPQAQKEARDYISERFGKDYMPKRAPIYKTKAKGAQEAHEAIRPTGVMREPDSIKKALSHDQFRLYNLIWQRFVASQMGNAVYNTLRVDIDAGLSANSQPYHFRVSGSTIKFSGFLALYEDARDEDAAADDDEGRILPEMTVGELLDLLDLLPEQHFTQPPPRYTEASIVRTLEEYGIGRPSTYAPTVAVIQDREYVDQAGQAPDPDRHRQDRQRSAGAVFPGDHGLPVHRQDGGRTGRDLRRQARMASDAALVLRSVRARTENRPRRDPVDERRGGNRARMPGLRQAAGDPLRALRQVHRLLGLPELPPHRAVLGADRHRLPGLRHEHGGEIIERRSRRGRVFFGCSRYPDCEFTSWKRPLPQPCPNCGGLLVEASRNKAECTVCKHTYQIDKLPSAEAEPKALNYGVNLTRGISNNASDAAQGFHPCLVCIFQRIAIA